MNYRVLELLVMLYGLAVPWADHMLRLSGAVIVPPFPRKTCWTVNLQPSGASPRLRYKKRKTALFEGQSLVAASPGRHLQVSSC